jgi:hypothetical protein
MKNWLPIFLLASSINMLSCNTNLHQESMAASPSLNISKLDTGRLQSGDIVVRLGNDITSNMLAQMNTRDKRFSHIGFCFKENNQWIVYHSLGAESGDNQYLRRDALVQFFNAENNLSIGIAFTKFDTSQRVAIYKKVKQWYDAKIPFDMAFELETDDKLYCSEMVAKAINYSLDSTIVPFTDTLAKQFYGIDDIIQSTAIEKVQFQTISKLAIHQN